MNVSIALQKKIIDFLVSLPNIHDSESQRAFIYQAGLDPKLQEQIPFGKPSGQFISLLVSILLPYGKLQDGRYALEAVLEAAKHFIGEDRRTEDCEPLIKELNELRIKKQSSPKSRGVRVHTGHLPQTGSEIFGRDKELEYLDKAWESRTSRIVVLFAWGGVGKSALVNKWVDNMQNDDYRDARRVYAWSFYSQGVGERVISADAFINEALMWFGDSTMAQSKRSPWDKGQRLAELIRQERTLLLLDGMEPLQSGLERDRGHVKDPALAVMLKELAKQNDGLCVITTREKLTGEEAYEEFIEQVRLEQISAEAGRQLLQIREVRGKDEELEQITSDFGNHALAISLLAEYLRQTPGRHVRSASMVPASTAIAVEDGRHPRRVMEAFVKHFGESGELNVLHMVGLFDRPATKGEIDALRRASAVPALTDRICGLDEVEWNRIVQNLRNARLIALESHHNPGGLDAHPVVRQHFGLRLRTINEKSYKQGHSCLYKFLSGRRDDSPEYPETFEEMEPLFQAVAHGCKADLHQETLNDVVMPRIHQGSKFVSQYKLAAFSADLAALSGFFDNPWDMPVARLTDEAKAYVSEEAGYCLRALGQLEEAIVSLRNAFDIYSSLDRWVDAADSAHLLSRSYLSLGDLNEAFEYAKQGVNYADRSKDSSAQLIRRTILGDVLHQMGKLEQAETIFQEARKIQEKKEPNFLHAMQGYYYCDLLLSQGKYQEVQVMADRAVKWDGRDEEKKRLIYTASGEFVLARAMMVEASWNSQKWGLDKCERLLKKASNDLRQAGYQEYIPPSLLSQAELKRVQEADFAGARHDLDEAHEVVRRSNLRLFDCDIHIECCRLILAMFEAGQTLERLTLAPSSPLTLFDVEKKPLMAARKHLDWVREMVREMGYHRRDPELLIETAHCYLVENDKRAARGALDEAKACIAEMDCRRWDFEVKKLAQRLG